MLAQGWSATQVAEALEREPHTIGNWLDNFRQGGAQGLVFEQTGVSPRLEPRSTEPTEVCGAKSAWGGGIELSNWNWKVVRQFLKQSFDLGLSRSSCLTRRWLRLLLKTSMEMGLPSGAWAMQRCPEAMGHPVRPSSASPDFNADEAVWDWAREEVTANECHGTKAQVQEKMNQFFGGLAHRKDEVKHRCRTLLQARADALIFTPSLPLPSLQNVVPTLALV